MDEEKLEYPCKKNTSAEFDRTDSASGPDVSLTQVTDPLIQQNIENGVMLIREKFEEERTAYGEIKPVLLNNNDKNKCHSLIELNSISSSTKCSSLNSLKDNELMNCQANVLQEKCLQKSSSYNDVRSSSPESLSSRSENILSDIETVVSNECSTLMSMPNDEEETLFNTKLGMDAGEEKPLQQTPSTGGHKNVEVESNIEAPRNMVQNFSITNALEENIGQVEDGKNMGKCEKVLNNEQNHPVSVRSTRLQNNVTARPSLADDSRLVKISLPTNPINIMQSNAQFLNKSRNFLNFITEKSTNIMEKALLPQHLAVKYNSVMKSIDNTYTEKKFVDEPCTTESPLTESAFSNESDLMTKEKPISCTTKLAADMSDENNECLLNNGSKSSSTTNLTESIKIEENGKLVLQNDSMLECDNSNLVDSKLKEVKQIELRSTANESNKTTDKDVFTEVNGNCNERIDPVVLNSESNNCEISPMKNLTDNTCEKEEGINLEITKHNLMQHPAYLTLLRDYADMKARCLKLEEKVEYLEERNRTLKAENKGEIFTIQIENLEKTINRLTHELHTSLTTQETLKKEYTAANKERESMVMKYAVGEKQLIDTQRARESAERKVKELGKQHDLLQGKLREMQGERARICNILDGKCREVMDLQKEVERLKEDVNMRDIKLKWTQTKLKTEMDLQKETQQKFDKATTRINEMREECEQVRKETQETMRKFQQSEENKAVTLDQQLKEQQARLILERHVTEDKEMLRLQLQKEVEVLKSRQQVLIEENNTLSFKIQDAEKSRLNYESNLSNLKIVADQRQKEIVELLSKVSELETLKVQLQQKDQYLASTETEMKHLRLANEELQADMFACRQKEAEMLDFTQKLTDKNVRLQSEFTAIEAKVKHLEDEHGPLHVRINELSNKIKMLEECLTREQRGRSEECEILAKRLAEQTEVARNLAQKLEDSQGENAVLKRKQQIGMKEMTRELQQCRKKLETFETSSPYNSLGVASRTGSNVSLNTGDTLNGALSDNSMNGDHSIQSIEPTKQALIERIIKLQEINAKKAEKLDFFEEHAQTLVLELQKKTRIIQNYILHENAGAMGSNERDRYKAELARHGGIMASVYNQRVSDDNMTLELSLEINQKLQAVLEDALFKNITLKDNIDTLGEEIARLTMKNQQRQTTN